MTSEPRNDFFISYRTLDESWAEWIAWQLEAAGYSTYVQAWDFRPGGNFVNEMQAGLMRCERTIAVLSRAYSQSGFTEAEWFAAFAQDPRGEQGLLLPVRVDDCEVEGLLGQVIHIDLFGVEESAARERLLAGVKPGRGKPERSPQYPGALKPAFPPLDRSNPYRGLAPFHAEHRSAFRGRDRYVAAVCSKLHEKRLVCIVGASGSGKSSLARAGVLPAEEERGALTAFCRPQHDPFRGLARGLMPHLEPNLHEPGPIWQAAEAYVRRFRDSPGDLENLLGFLIDGSRAPGLVILVDQLEELFSQVPEADRAPFVELLASIWETRRLPVKWLLTLRADFMEQALQYDRLRAMLQDATVLLGPMDEQELRAAILEPAQMLGVRFEAGLPERLVQDAIATGPSTASKTVATLAGRLPLLEFALTELWTRQRGGVITHADYDDPETGVGGIEGALRQHAELVYGHYDEDRQARTRRLFRRLVERGPGLADVRRLVARDEVAADWDDLVADLAKQRLVTTGESAVGEVTVEVIHEALLRSWPALRGWISENREFDLWRQGLTEQCEKWEQAATTEKPDLLLRGTQLDKALVNQREHAPELSAHESAFIDAGRAARDRDRKRRNALVAAAFAVVVAIAAAAGWQWWRAEIQTSIAEAQRQRALARALAAEAAQLVERGQGTAAEFRAAALAVESWKRMPNADAHAAAVTLMNRMPVIRYAGPPITRGPLARILGVTFSPNGRYVAVGRQSDGVRLIDTVTGKERAHIGSEKPDAYFRIYPYNLGFSPDGSVLMSLIGTGEQKELDLIRTESGEVFFSASGKQLASGAQRWYDPAFSNDSRYFAFESGANVQVIDLDTGSQVFQAEQAGADQPLFSPDSTLLAVQGFRSHALLEVPSGRKRASIEGTDYVNHWYFSDEGKSLLLELEEMFDENRGLWIVDTETSVTTATFPLSTSGPRAWLSTSEAAGVVAVQEKTNNRIRLIRLSDGEEKHRFEDSAEVRWFDLYDDGRKLLVWRWPDIIELIDTGSGGVLRRIDFGEEITRLYGAPGNALFVAVGKSGATATYAGETGQLLTRFDRVGSLVGFTPNAELLVTSQPLETVREQRFRFYDTRDGRELADIELDGRLEGMVSPFFSVDGRYLALPGGAGFSWDLLVVDTSGIGGPVWIEQADASPLRFSPDGRNVAIEQYDDRVVVVSADTRKPLLVIPPTHNVSDVAFSPDGQLLAVWGKDSTRLFEVATGTQRAEILATGRLSDIEFSADGRMLALAGQEGWVRTADTASGAVRFELPGDGKKRKIALHPNGELLAVIREDSGASSHMSCSSGKLPEKRIWGPQACQKDAEDCTYRILDADTGAERFSNQLDVVPFSVAFSPDGATLAIGTHDDNTTRLIDASSGAEKARVEHQYAPGCRGTVLTRFAPDSRAITVVTQRKARLTTWLFDPESGEERARVDAGKRTWKVPGDDDDYPLLVHHAVSFSRDGRYFAIGSIGGGLARLLAAPTGREVLRMELGEDYVGVAFSPDGRYLAAASRNGAVGLASIEEQREVARLRHGAGVTRLQFNPDSNILATASEDGTVLFTQVRDGRALARFELGEAADHIAFSPDGKWLATQSKGVARLLRADPGWPIEQLCRRTGVNLSRSEWSSLIGPDEPWRPTCTNWRNPDPN